MSKYYGDSTRWFIGEVIDATPPFGYEGRVRVRIHGVHNPSTRSVRQDDLPWAQVVLPTTEGGVSGLGTSPRLEAGALVFGVFMDGKESQVPIVIGSLPRTEYPTTVQQSLAFQDLIERVNPDIEFYNQSIAGIDKDDESLDDQRRDKPVPKNITNYRQDTAVRFFLASGYSMKQSCALVGAISRTNPTFNTTYENNDGIGLVGWKGTRLTNLKQFSANWWFYSTQLAFIIYELNTTHVDANIRILNSDVIDPAKPKSLGAIIGRYYAPQEDDYRNECKRIYELYANKKV